MGSAKKDFVLKDEKNIPKMVAAVRKMCKDNDIDFDGDEKSGTASRAGAEITYKVNGKNVHVEVEDSWRSRRFGWDADKIMAKVAEGIVPYT